MRPRSTLKVSLSLALLASSALGQPSAPSRADKAAADALFDDAKRLLQEGKYVEACPKLEESQRLDPGIGTLLYLGDCYEKLGKLATAWTTFREAADAARVAGQGDREKIATRLASALEAKLPRLTVVVPPASDLPDLVVKRNGVPLGRALWGTALPIDPGPQVIEASAPSHQTFTRKLDVAPGASGLVVEVPRLAGASAAPPVQSASAKPPPPPPSSPPPGPSPDDGQSSRRTLALVAGGIGVVGVGVGSYLGLRTFSLWDEAKSGCPADRCTSDAAYDSAGKAKTYGNLSTAFFIVGAAGLGAGAYLWLTMPSSTTAIAPVVSPQHAGISMKGAW